MILCEAVTLSEDEFLDAFDTVEQAALYEYFDAIAEKKCQLFKLSFQEKFSYLITSVSKVRGITFFNVLELQGDIGYATYPIEFLELLKQLGNNAQADELRVMATRDGSRKMLLKHGFDLRYAEYGFNLK